MNYQPITGPTRNWRFSASYDSSAVAQTFVLRKNICGKNHQLLLAANHSFHFFLKLIKSYNVIEEVQYLHLKANRGILERQYGQVLEIEDLTSNF